MLKLNLKPKNGPVGLMAKQSINFAREGMSPSP